MIPRVLIYREILLGSSETFILNQIRHLRRYDPVLVGRHRVDGLDLNALPVAIVKSRRAAARRELESHRPDLMHAHFGPDGLAAQGLARSLELPLVVTFHGYDATQQARLIRDPALWLYRKRLSWLFRRAACFVAVSDHINRALVELGAPPERVSTQHIGVDLSAFVSAPIEARDPIVLAVGRCVEKKGFATLIDAMHEVQRTRPQVRLVVIGDGPLLAELKAQGATRRVAVDFLGALPREDVEQWMRRARVLAVPSVTASNGDTEGLPTTLIEGMASGTPVVGTFHAGIPEAIEDHETGLLVSERDPIALARGLGNVLDDDELWARLSVGGRRRAEERFDIARQTMSLETLYDDVVASAKRR